MSYDTKMDRITLDEVVYDVERSTDTDGATKLTLSLDGEPAFVGLFGTLGYDEADDNHNPREWSNVGVMGVSYGHYKLGDYDISNESFEMDCESCDGTGDETDRMTLWKRIPDHWRQWDHIGTGTVAAMQAELEILRQLHPENEYDVETDISCAACKGDGKIIVSPPVYFHKVCGARVVIGLTVYEHSGITMRAGDVTLPWDSDRWDTSFVGFIYDTPETVRECFGDNFDDELIRAALVSEVDTYAAYLEGNVMYYSVEDPETNYYDACGGYVGTNELCEEQCFHGLEDAMTKRLAEINERNEMAARDIITVN